MHYVMCVSFRRILKSRFSMVKGTFGIPLRLFLFSWQIYWIMPVYLFIDSPGQRLNCDWPIINLWTKYILRAFLIIIEYKKKIRSRIDFGINKDNRHKFLILIIWRNRNILAFIVQISSNYAMSCAMAKIKYWTIHDKSWICTYAGWFMDYFIFFGIYVYTCMWLKRKYIIHKQ